MEACLQISLKLVSQRKEELIWSYRVPKIPTIFDDNQFLFFPVSSLKQTLNNKEEEKMKKKIRQIPLLELNPKKKFENIIADSGP